MEGVSSVSILFHTCPDLLEEPTSFPIFFWWRTCLGASEKIEKIESVIKQKNFSIWQYLVLIIPTYGDKS